MSAAAARLATVHLLRWLRRQLAQPGPFRERLEAAVANSDPAEVRRLVSVFDFTEDQRHHVERLLTEWERALVADEIQGRGEGTP